MDFLVEYGKQGVHLQYCRFLLGNCLSRESDASGRQEDPLGKICIN